ncbi:MAG TPA: hypothetical protein VFF81_09345 [Noviherbaspirillum sp.]|nr:hypothetical protein [Noviherbaspirillum sp.]
MSNKDVSNNLPSGQPKRGRGRPRKADALTDAQRAARYRARKKEKLKAAQGSEPVQEHAHSAEVSAKEQAFAKELEDANKRINDLSGALDVVVSIASKGKLIPADVLAGLYRLLSSR